MDRELWRYLIPGYSRNRVETLRRDAKRRGEVVSDTECEEQIRRDAEEMGRRDANQEG